MGTDDPDPVHPDPVAGFAAALRELRIAAGEPSYRTLATRCGYGHATVHEALTGRRLPPLPLTLALVEALGGDPTQWQARWIETRTATAPPPPGSPAAQAQVPVTPPGHPAAGSAFPPGAMHESPADRPATSDPSPPMKTSRIDSPRLQRPALHRTVSVVAAAAAVVLVIVWSVTRTHSPSHPGPALSPAPGLAPGSALPGLSRTGESGCRTVARYRLTEEGDLRARGGDAIIGTVNRGDQVDLLDRVDPAHPYRYAVLVERTGKVGTVDLSKLARSGTSCIQKPSG